MTTIRIVLGLAVALAMGWTAGAQDGPRSRQSLRGLASLEVGVGVSADREDEKRTLQAQIQTDVELRLRQNSIPVDAGSDARLYVRVSAMPICFRDSVPAGHAYTVTVEVDQPVILASGVTTRADTWTTGPLLGISGSLSRTVRDTVRDQVDRFINAYLAANQK
jgi:hypothetical protein